MSQSLAGAALITAFQPDSSDIVDVELHSQGQNQKQRLRSSHNNIRNYIRYWYADERSFAHI
jgi:hypothetical protein